MGIPVLITYITSVSVTAVALGHTLFNWCTQSKLGRTHLFGSTLARLNAATKDPVIKMFTPVTAPYDIGITH